MRSAGLSILETTILERTRLAADDRLELYRHKTGEPVYLPFEPELANELRRIAAIPEQRLGARSTWTLYLAAEGIGGRAKLTTGTISVSSQTRAQH
jgi:hypothetical protein